MTGEPSLLDRRLGTSLVGVGEFTDVMAPCSWVLEVTHVGGVLDYCQPARRYRLMQSMGKLHRETHVSDAYLSPENR